MKDKIFNYINKYQNVTFAELSKNIEGFKGNLELNAHDNPNIIFWQFLSTEAFDALQKLMKEKILDLKPASMLTYFIDGIILKLPIVTKNLNYQTPHWLPVVLNIKKQK